MVTWQIKYVISPHSQGPCPPPKKKKKLGRVLTQDRGPHPQSQVTSILQSHDNSKNSYILNCRVCALETKQSAGYSVVATIELCAEGNWLIRILASFHPLSKNVYVKFERSCRDATENLCPPKINTKMPTRTKNDEIN